MQISKYGILAPSLVYVFHTLNPIYIHKKNPSANPTRVKLRADKHSFQYSSTGRLLLSHKLCSNKH